MITDYLIVVSTIVTITLIWRNLKDDHPKLKAWVKRIPVVGTSLSCGFCMPLWTSFAAVAILNPLETWSKTYGEQQSSIEMVAIFLVGWMSVGAGVLLLRSLIITLMEGGAVLKHLHKHNHPNT